MKFHYISLALAACLSTAAAQGLDSLPSCAKDCATGAIPDHCGQIDVGCICSDRSFLSNISCCVSNKCSEGDQKSVIQFANQICSGAGVKDLPTSATCASGESPATESSSETTGSASSTATGKTSDASTTSASKISTTSGSESSRTASSTGTSSDSAQSAATSTGAATLVQGKDTSLLAAAGAALFAFLA